MPSPTQERRNGSLFIVEIDPATIYSIVMGALGAATVSQLVWGSVYPIPVSLGMLGGYAFGKRSDPKLACDERNLAGHTYSNNF